MCSSRRVFIGAWLSFAASAAAVWATQQGLPASQFPPPFRPPETPELPRNQKRDRLMLKANRAVISKDVTRMSELIDALQKQLKEQPVPEPIRVEVPILANGQLQELNSAVQAIVTVSDGLKAAIAQATARRPSRRP